MIRVRVNKEVADKIWGGIHEGYFVLPKEIKRVLDPNGDIILTLIKMGNGWEIDYIKRT